MAASEQLRPAFHGPVHLPGELAYDAHRTTWSGKIDPRPAVVAEASTPSDVRAAVLIAQEHGLPFAVQSTGHGTHVPADGGLLLKTSLMAEVLVDPDRRIARVGPGARMGDIVAAAAPFGLAPIAGSNPTVGVAGFTLGGGFGPLSRRHGFAADSLLRVDLVTADGRLLRASADEHHDLFWAVRGGGGNFGVVTALEFRLYPIETAYAGMLIWDRKDAEKVLRAWARWAVDAPDAVTTAFARSVASTAARSTASGSSANSSNWRGAVPPSVAVSA